MQKWEYKTIYQKRGWGGGNCPKHCDEWTLAVDLELLGNEGWELVNVIAKSDYIGDICSGTVTSQLWVFKRPVL